MVRPDSSTAVVALPGTPRVRVGIRVPPVTALLAASQQATPSRAPWPKSSSLLNIRPVLWET